MSKLSNPEIHSINQQINSLKATLQAESVKVESMKVYDPLKIQTDIDLLQSKIDSHNDFMAEQAEVERKKLQASKKVLDKTLVDLRKMADRLDDAWVNIHHTHRGRVADIKSTLRQVLR